MGRWTLLGALIASVMARACGGSEEAPAAAPSPAPPPTAPETAAPETAAPEADAPSPTGEASAPAGPAPSASLVSGPVAALYSEHHPPLREGTSVAPQLLLYFQSGAESGVHIHDGEPGHPTGPSPLLDVHHRSPKADGEESLYYRHPPLGWSSPTRDAQNASGRLLWRTFGPAEGAPFDVSAYRFLNVWVRPLDGFEGTLAIELGSWDPERGGANGDAAEAQGTLETLPFPQRIRGEGWSSLSIPLERFGTVDLGKLARYRFVFDSSADGHVFLLDEITLSAERPPYLSPASGGLSLTEEGRDPREADDRLTLRVELERRHQVVRGFGFQLDGPPAAPEELIDRLGASLVRVAIPVADPPAPGEEGRGFEPSNDDGDPTSFLRSLEGFRTVEVDAQAEWMRALRERAPDVRFLACPWSAPGWMKSGGRVSGGSQLGAQANRLRRDARRELGEYLAAYALALHRRGVPLAALSIGNEIRFNHDFPSMFLEQEDVVAVLAAAGALLERAEAAVPGFVAPRLVAEDHVLDEYFYEADFLPFFAALRGAPRARRAMDVLSFHGYGPGGIRPAQVSGSLLRRLLVKTREELGPAVELWMTETSGMHDGLLSEAGRPGALRMAEGIHDVLVYANGAAWVHFDAEEELLRFGALSWPGVALAHYARFLRPGATRLEAKVVGGDARVLVVLARNPAGAVPSQALVLVNMDARPHGLDLSALPGERYREVRSSRHHALEDLGELRPAATATAPYVLPPQAIVTLHDGPAR